MNPAKKLASLSIALLLIQACSHPIEIVGEGDVTSSSGDRDCSLEQFTAADPDCSKNYVIGAYQETYYATPRAGWTFDHWGNNYCPNAIPPNYDCSFNVAAATVQQFWGQTMPPLKAVFIPLTGGTPIMGADIVTANGKQWAQPDLFLGVTWNQIDAVCSGGPCAAGGLLKGYDMTGWTWASWVDVAELFVFYGVPISVSQPQHLIVLASQWAPAFFVDPWRPTRIDEPTAEYSGAKCVLGWSREFGIVSTTYASKPSICAVNPPYTNVYDAVWTDFGQLPTTSNIIHGSWFYRVQP